MEELTTEGTSESRIVTPTPPLLSLTGAEDELEIALYELLQTERWTAALSFVKQNRGAWGVEQIVNGDDDIIIAIKVYSRKIIKDKPGGYKNSSLEKEETNCFVFLELFVMTNMEHDLSEVFGRLFQVSTAVSDLEKKMKERDQSYMSTENQSKN